MKQNRRTSSVLLLLCIVLLAATALMMSGCNTETAGSAPTSDTTTAAGTTTTAGDGYEVRGTGQTAFYFIAEMADGTQTKFEVRTDKGTVGEALLEVGLIAGDVELYGLYVKTVNGVTLDYTTDGKYWAFYENGEYGVLGVDSTAVVAGATYSFRAES